MSRRDPGPSDGHSLLVPSELPAWSCCWSARSDESINAGWPAFEAALQANDKTYVMHMYEGVNHGFHNDTTPRYDEAAATLAQERTMAFFNEHLRG